MLTVLTALDADQNVRGVLVAGSLARGTARADSDLDVLVVVEHAQDEYAWRQDGYDLEVDFGLRTVPARELTFAPDRVGGESWGHAFLDGIIARDSTDRVGGLIRRAAATHAGYPDTGARRAASPLVVVAHPAEDALRA